MTRYDLSQLYTLTSELFASPSSPLAGLDWIDRVLPRFTGACAAAAVAGSRDAIDEWRAWVAGDGIESIRDAGDPEMFVWRRTWLTTLLGATGRLATAEAYKHPESRRRIATDLYECAEGLFATFPEAFWNDLVDLLSGEPRPAVEDHVSVGFPLVLSEPMCIRGDTIDILIADFVLEPLPSAPGDVYLDPAQVTDRCLDPQFAVIFAQAAEVAARQIAPLALPGARVRLQARRPDDDLFLRKLTLRGPSGGGALAAGLYGLARRATIRDESVAISFALTPPGALSPDSACHAVGGAYEKVRGCAKQGIKTLLVADEQASQVSFYGHLQNIDIVGADSFADAMVVIDAASHAPAAPSPVSVSDDGGVLAIDSPLYVERRSDAAFHAALAQRPMIVLVKGARQIGKTSLLVRGVTNLRRREVKVVYIDMQSLGRDSLRSQKDLYITLARIFARELKIDAAMEDIYDDRDGPNKNFENYLFKYALGSPVIWFMDEVDRLFDFDFYTDVFSLMRSWHNRRPIHQELANLTVVLSYSTETHLLIEDAYQSPFNVGTKVELADFTMDQVIELNDKLGSPLNESEIRPFYQLAGGHPHLVCRGLSWMSTEHHTLDDLKVCASLDNGPYGNHLSRLRRVAQNVEQLNVLQALLRGAPVKNTDAVLHLRSAGVIVGDDHRNVRMRCVIYADYLRRHVLPENERSVVAVGGRGRFWPPWGRRRAE